MPKRRRPVRSCWEFRFLLLVAATAAAAAAADNDDEEDDIAHLYSILSECRADPEESTLEFVVEYWSHVGPLWSPLADLGILLAFLGLIVPLVCTAIGAAYCAYFVKETTVLLYLGLRGRRISGEVVGLHTQHWADHHLARSSVTVTGGSQTYCRATVRYRSHFELSNSNSSLDGWLRRDFLLQTIPPRGGKVDLLVSRSWPAISRVVDEGDTSLLQQLRLTIKLLGLLLLSCIVGGLLLTMIIEIIPPLCHAKKILWMSFITSFFGYIAHLLLTESRHGATSGLTNQEESLGTQSYRGYEYIPDVDAEERSSCEDTPPTAIPIAEQVVSVDNNIPITSAQATCTRSIFGPRRQDHETATVTATATVIE